MYPLTISYNGTEIDLRVHTVIESPNFVGIVDFRFQNIGQNFNASVHVGFQ